MRARSWAMRLAMLGGPLAASSACGHDASPTRVDPVAALGGEIAARVGSDAIPLTLVARVADAQHVSAREATRRLVDDAIAANAARSKGLDRASPASWLLVAARGRFAADRLFEEAKKQGPATDDEVRILSDVYWREVDRPPAVRVIHVVVKKPEKGGEDALVRAREAARELRATLIDAPTPAEFEAKATAFPPRPGVETKFEKLPSFTEDGWVVDGDGRMSEKFSRPAFALPSPGDTSEVVESEFGWHVIRLVERIAEQRVPVETRRSLFADEAYKRRSAAALKSRLTELQQKNPVRISPAAEQLMRSVSIEAPKELGSNP